MKKLRCWAGVLIFVAFGAAAQASFATELSEVIASSIELEGFLLDAFAMEEIEGGLPRACHDPNYDPIENACLNNKGQKYVSGENDCDIWAEKVLRESGKDITSIWGSAKTTTISGHRVKLAKQLKNDAPQGWSIQIIDSGHVALMRVNSDGSADLYHQGENRNLDSTVTWESRGYHYSNVRNARWGNERKFWGL